MKRIFTAAVFCLAVIVSAFAQDAPKGKQNIFVDYFSRTVSTPFIWAETLRNAVIEGIQKTDRVNVIDVDSRSTLAVERERREQETTVAGNDLDRLKVMTEEGANYLVQGLVNDISVKTITHDSGSRSYEASISYTLKVINPANGLVTYTQNFRLPLSILGVPLVLDPYGDTEDEAVQKMATGAVKQMKKFVENAFPVQGTVLQADRIQGDKAKTVFINLGSDHGVMKDGKFDVRLRRTVAGRESLTSIGEIQIEEIQGGDISVCKVKKGDKEILDALNAGQTLVIQSKN